MGGSLGRIEAIRREASAEPDTFELLDEHLELRWKPSGWAALEWTALAAEQKDAQTDEEKGELGIRMAQSAQKLLERSLTPASFARFKELSDENELGLDVVFRIVNLLIGAAAGRPTGKPSDSSDGLSNTSMSSSTDADILQMYAAKGLQLVPVNDPRVRQYTGISA